MCRYISILRTALYNTPFDVLLWDCNNSPQTSVMIARPYKDYIWMAYPVHKKYQKINTMSLREVGMKFIDFPQTCLLVEMPLLVTPLSLSLQQHPDKTSEWFAAEKLERLAMRGWWWMLMKLGEVSSLFLRHSHTSPRLQSATKLYNCLVSNHNQHSHFNGDFVVSFYGFTCYHLTRDHPRTYSAFDGWEICIPLVVSLTLEWISSHSRWLSRLTINQYELLLPKKCANWRAYWEDLKGADL